MVFQVYFKKLDPMCQTVSYSEIVSAYMYMYKFYFIYKRTENLV